MNAAVEVGTRLPEWQVPEVSAEKMKTTAALLRDPTPIHWDAAVLQELGMGQRPINQGPLNMAYVMNMLAAFAGGPDRLRRLRVRFRGNVRAGDRLRAGGVVTAVRAGPEGSVLCDCDVELSVVNEGSVNEGSVNGGGVDGGSVDGETVLSGTATVELYPGTGDVPGGTGTAAGERVDE